MLFIFFCLWGEEEDAAGISAVAVMAAASIHVLIRLAQYNDSNRNCGIENGQEYTHPVL